MKTLLREPLYKRLAYIEQVLTNSDFVFGERFSIADAYLFTVLSWSDHLQVALETFPGIHRFRERIGKRPSVIAALHAQAQSDPVV